MNDLEKYCAERRDVMRSQLRTIAYSRFFTPITIKIDGKEIPGRMLVRNGRSQYQTIIDKINKPKFERTAVRLYEGWKDRLWNGNLT